MKDFGRLTLEEKVGQLFFIGFSGAIPDANTRALLDLVRPGGIVLSQRNIENFEQLYELTSGFVQRPAVPSFIGIYQEGGPIDRLKQLFAPLPPLHDVGDLGVLHVRLLARIIASELEATGFNTSFTPVLDLDAPQSVMHSRTLASNPVDVTRLASAFCEEFLRKGILPCPKHFPGIGGARLDPHFGLPKIDISRKKLLQEDALPFLNLIDDVPMMMVGHAYYPALMDERPMPACLSSKVVDGLLRKKFGFHGLILTDDLTMGAVNSTGLTPETFLRAFEAGNDMMVFSQSTPLVEQAFRLIGRAVRQSAVLRTRLDQSVERILSTKHRLPASPLRYRSQTRARVLRQIERLERTLEVNRPRVALHS